MINCNNHTPSVSPIDQVLSRLNAVRSGRGYKACCPAHDDHNPSLSIREGSNGKIQLTCFAGCTQDEIVKALDLDFRDLMPRQDDTHHQPNAVTAYRKRDFASHDAALKHLEVTMGTVSKVWEYHTPDGRTVGIVARWNLGDGKKVFRPISLKEGKWHIGAMDEPRPLYGLPAVKTAPGRVYVTEGEKAADAARSIGLVAVTSSGGALAAGKSDWSTLAGTGEVIIIPDNDAPGEKYAKNVASEISRLNPKPKVKILRLAGLPEQGDIVDWLEQRDATEPESLCEEIERLASVAESVLDTNPVLEEAIQTGRPQPVFRRMSEVTPATLNWLWHGRIPSGKITLIAGDPGLGKSFLTMDIAARISRGTAWPDAPEHAISAGSVLIFNAEDDIRDTILHRLVAANADLAKIQYIESMISVNHAGQQQTRGFKLDRDLRVLEEWLRNTPDAVLIIIDPISAYCGDVDTHRNSDVREMLAPLAKLAGEYGVAVVCVTHLSKGAGGKAIYRATGSLAFAAAARSMFSVHRDLNNPQRRLLLPVKNNLAKETTGLAYSIENGCIRWEADPVHMTADEYTATEENCKTESVAERSQAEAAVEFVRQQLASGPRHSKDVLEEGREFGFSDKQIRKAFNLLQGKRRKLDFKGPWEWSLQVFEDSQPDIEDDQEFNF